MEKACRRSGWCTLVILAFVLAISCTEIPSDDYAQGLETELLRILDQPVKAVVN